MYRSVTTSPINGKYNVAFILETERSITYFSQFEKQMLSTNTYSLDEAKVISSYLITNGIAFDGQVIITDNILECYMDSNDSVNSQIKEDVNNNPDVIFAEVLCFCNDRHYTSNTKNL